MKLSTSFIKNAGFALAFTSFVIMAGLAASAGSRDPIQDFFDSEVAPGKGLPPYLLLFITLDLILVSGWLRGWWKLKYSTLSGNGVIFRTVFWAGIAGPVLDYMETLLSAAAMIAYQNASIHYSQLYALWIPIMTASYYLPYAVSMVLGIFLFSKKKFLRAAVVNFAGMPSGLAAMLFPALETFTYLWWPLWFITMALTDLYPVVESTNVGTSPANKGQVLLR